MSKSIQQLIIIISGKKQSGKNSAANFILSQYLNMSDGISRFTCTEEGDLMDYISGTILSFDAVDSLEQLEEFWKTHNVKLYSFADPLKDFLINVFGLEERQCYGTDEDKNSLTHLRWDDQFSEVRKKYSKRNRRTGRLKMASGFMTAREVMQVFGTDWCRRMDSNCWARALYRKIQKERFPIAIVTDARFPNEITMGTEIGAKAIRLMRNPFDDKHDSEIALDDFPLGEFTLVVNNDDLSITEKNLVIHKHLCNWFKQHGIVSRNTHMRTAVS